jgi:hypothetical protein
MGGNRNKLKGKIETISWMKDSLTPKLSRKGAVYEYIAIPSVFISRTEMSKKYIDLLNSFNLCVLGFYEL